MRKLTVGSLFAGVGGFDLAFEQCGMEVVWQVENDPQCQAVLRRHWPKADLHGDIHDVGTGDIRSESGAEQQGQAGINSPSPEGAERSDGEGGCGTAAATGGGNGKGNADGGTGRLVPVSVIVGGFPCQDYSVAGKRGGLAGDRGALWWQMLRVIAECRPTWVVAENVPGLLSSNGGRDFITIVASLVQCGYGVSWAVLDSQHFGVAQRRRRLFIVGHIGGEPRPEILAISEGMFGHPAPRQEKGQKVAGSLGGRAGNEGGFRGDLDNHGAYPLQRLGAVQGGNDYGANKGTLIQQATPLLEVGARTGREGHESGHGLPIVPTLRAGQNRTGGDRPPGTDVDTVESLQLEEVESNTIKNVTGHHGDTFIDPRDPAYCLPARGGNVVGGAAQAVVQTVPRKLTPLECERLQGFPDNHTEYGSFRNKKGRLFQKRLKDGARYRMMGNAVTRDVAEWIGQRIVAAETGDHD